MINFQFACLAERRHPEPEDRGGGWEEQPLTRCQGQMQGGAPHVQGQVAAQAQEGLEELSHIAGQEGRWREDTPHQW